MYYFSNLHKNHKFITLFTLIAGLGVLFGVYSVYINYNTTLDRISQDRSNQYTNLTKELIADTNNIIINDNNNPGLKYYYAKINDLKDAFEKLDVNDRDLCKEFAFTSLIFDKITHIIIYIKYISETEEDYVINNLMFQVSNILETYMKTPEFVENWKKYKKIYANENIIHFMMKNFNV